MPESAHVLAVFAHPDDETFTCGGTFALLSDAGCAVTLVCATRGEVGDISDPTLATRETLPAVRERELRTAMASVGVTDVRFLGYRDSGMEGTPENADPRAFANASDETIVAQLLEMLTELNPVIVITFGPDGMYGHPDHLKTYRTATAAVRRFGARSGRGPALYYHATPRERVLELAKRGRGAFAEMSESQLAKFGIPQAEITTEIDVSGAYERKQAAMRAHRTQFAADGPLSEFPPEEVRDFIGIERFRRAPLPWEEPGRDPLLALLGAPVSG